MPSVCPVRPLPAACGRCVTPCPESHQQRRPIGIPGCHGPWGDDRGVFAQALMAGTQTFGPIQVDPLLHDMLARHGSESFELTAAAAAQPDGPGAQDIEPIRLHMRSYGQNSLCDNVIDDDKSPTMAPRPLLPVRYRNGSCRRGISSVPYRSAWRT